MIIHILLRLLISLLLTLYIYQVGRAQMLIEDYASQNELPIDLISISENLYQQA